MTHVCKEVYVNPEFYPKAPLPTTLIFSYFSIAAPKRFRRLQATRPRNYRKQRGTKTKKKAKEKLSCQIKIKKKTLTEVTVMTIW